MALQDQVTEEKNKQVKGQVMQVLVEGVSAKQHADFVKTSDNMQQMTGRTASNKVVHFPSDTAAAGDLVDIQITDAYLHSLWGKPLERQTS